MSDRGLEGYLAKTAPEFLAALKPIRDAVGKVWTHVQHEQYTDHGVGHSERVVAAGLVVRMSVRLRSAAHARPPSPSRLHGLRVPGLHQGEAGAGPRAQTARRRPS